MTMFTNCHLLILLQNGSSPIEGRALPILGRGYIDRALNTNKGRTLASNIYRTLNTNIDKHRSTDGIPCMENRHKNLMVNTFLFDTRSSHHRGAELGTKNS